MITNKKISFFGAGVCDVQSSEYTDVLKLGEVLGSFGTVEVHCGGYGGLMEAISKGVHNTQGRIVGHTCRSFPSIVGNKYLTETVVHNDIFDRLRSLITDKDIFILSVGGVGTISEFFLVLDVLRKIKKNKPVVYLVGDFWDNILNSKVFDYIQVQAMSSVIHVPTIDELILLLTIDINQK